MWPLDRRCDVVRLGRDRVEYWANESKAMTLADSRPLNGLRAERLPQVAGAAGALLDAVVKPRSAARRRLRLIVESAWLPVMAVDMGNGTLSAKAADALAEHHFSRLYGPCGPESRWQVRTEYRPGTHRCLAYGWSSEVSSVCDAIAAKHQIDWESVEPAFAWGWARHGARGTSWFVWLEQDRMLVARARRGRVIALTPGAAREESAARVLAAVDVERARWGFDNDDSEPIVVAGWDGVTSMSRAATAPARHGWMPKRAA